MSILQLSTALVAVAMLVALVVAVLHRGRQSRKLHFQRMAEAAERSVRDGADD